MKTSSTWNFRSIVGKIMMGLVLAVMIGSIGAAPALGKDNDKRRGKQDNRRYEQRDARPYGYHYGYRERTYYYPPPPVVYAPPRPPGISIFFPPFFINP
jgi:hypothetical protein